MSDPERIFLEAECCVDPDYGRQWNSRDLGPNEDCDNESPWVEYVRADLVDPVALGQKDAVIADLTESLDEAKYDEPELRSKLDTQRQRIEQLEAALIEPDNGQIRCIVCKRQTYAEQEILHKGDCPLFAGGSGS